MIFNAANRYLNQNPGTLPDMGDALTNWFQQISFTKITKTVVNHIIVESPLIIDFMGVIQPLTVEKLMMKKEGQRSWVWKMVHAEPGLILKTDEIITYLCVQYRVQEKLDYKEYGYVEYHLVQDYQGSGP